jgi:hypothetical protein
MLPTCTCIKSFDHERSYEGYSRNVSLDTCIYVFISKVCLKVWEIISNKNVLHQTKVHLTDLIGILYLNGFAYIDTGHKVLYVSTNISYWHFNHCF